MAENSDPDGHISASRGSHHNTFRTHGLTANVYNSLPTPRRPLRDINDNAQFLRSPGPLESMLKTTTETGDIGLFTIRPSIPPATFHPAPRSRPGLCDAQLLHASRSKALENESMRDDRQRLPSHYRDTTSEILSLYGSGTDSQPSYSRSLSSSNDDGWRSYSLNTTHSRHISHQKSSATLPHHSSLASLQRPRSPFPYPTRLKRPGIRPASPALMGNGFVDYTKMVELDRVSYVWSPGRGSEDYTFANNFKRREPSMDRIVQHMAISLNVPCCIRTDLMPIDLQFRCPLEQPPDTLI
jgi:hypothetical protein